MRNLLLIFACIIAFNVNTDAQVKLGLRTAIAAPLSSNESQYIVGTNDRVDYELSLMNSTATKSIGIYSQMNFGILYFQPEVLYSTYSNYYEVKNFSDRIIGEGMKKETFHTIDIPVNAGVTFNGFRIGGGPVFHINQGIDSELEEITNFENRSKLVNFGFQGGIGYDYGIFHIDLKYENAFYAVSDYMYFDSKNTKFETSRNNISLGLGIAF